MLLIYTHNTLIWFYVTYLIYSDAYIYLILIYSKADDVVTQKNKSLVGSAVTHSANVFQVIVFVAP